LAANRHNQRPLVGLVATDDDHLGLRYAGPFEGVVFGRIAVYELDVARKRIFIRMARNEHDRNLHQMISAQLFYEILGFALAISEENDMIFNVEFHKSFLFLLKFFRLWRP